MDKMTIMDTNYARLSLKTQSLLTSFVTNLPTDIQFHRKARLCLGPLTYGLNISKNLLEPYLDELDKANNVYIYIYIYFFFFFFFYNLPRGR